MKFANSREHGSKVIRDWKKPKNRVYNFYFIKLIGTYKAYAKYMILVAPDFPGETGDVVENLEILLVQNKG